MSSFAHLVVVAPALAQLRRQVVWGAHLLHLSLLLLLQPHAACTNHCMGARAATRQLSRNAQVAYFYLESFAWYQIINHITSG